MQSASLHTQSVMLYVLIYASIAVRLAAIVRGVASGLIRAHIFFFAMVALMLTRAVVSLTVDLPRYHAFYEETLWPVAILEAAAMIEAFWLVAAHFRKIRGFGWALMGVIAAVAALAAAAVGLMRAHWEGYLSGAMLFQTYAYVGLLISALLSFAFFAQFRDVPIRTNAIRHLLILSVFFGFYFLASFSAQISKGSSRFLTNLLYTLGANIAFIWWAVAMTRKGEELPFAPPPPISRSEFEAAEAEYRENQKALRQAGNAAIGKLRQP